MDVRIRIRTNLMNNKWYLFMNALSVVFLAILIFVGIRNFQVHEETFTELYFSDHQLLPRYVEPDQDYDIEFTVHNKQNVNEEYLYQLLIQTDQGEKILFEDIVRIANDDIWTTKVNFRVEPSFTNGKIILRLPEKDQEIHFLIFKK